MFVPLLVAFTSLAEGERCPAGVDVEARVREILHLAPERELTESFLVERHEAGLYVVLKSEDSTTIGERTLPMEGSCDELAQAAAVVLSAWLSDVHPDFAGVLPPAPAAEPKPEAPPPPAPPQRAPVAPVPVAPVSPPERAYRLEASLGAAVGLAGGSVDFSGSSFAPGAFAGVGYFTPETGVGLAAGVLIDGNRTLALGSGQVSFRRWPLALGPTLRLTAGPLTWDFSGGATLSWLYVSGRSFSPNRSQNDATLGAFVSGRVSGAGKTWRPFAQLALLVWPAESSVYVSGSGAEQGLPPVCGVLTAGATLVQ